MDSRMLNRVSLPVSAIAYQGAADLHGILSFDGDSLRLGFQTADALFGLLKSRPRELALPLTALDQIDCRPGFLWLRPYIELQCNDFALLADVPSSESGRLRLRLRLGNRQLARKLVDAVRFARAEALHAALSEGIEPAQRLSREPEQSRQPESTPEVQPDQPSSLLRED